jgi:hypothetical protein
MGVSCIDEAPRAFWSPISGADAAVAAVAFTRLRRVRFIFVLLWRFIIFFLVFSGGTGSINVYVLANQTNKKRKKSLRERFMGFDFDASLLLPMTCEQDIIREGIGNGRYHIIIFYIVTL